MPHPMYLHDCCPSTPSPRSSKQSCPACGAPGVRDGWGLGAIEERAQYQRTYALAVYGPHKPLAFELFRGLRSECGRCRGSGYVGGEERYYCPDCEGFGGAWVAPEAHLVRAYREVLRRYPHAARPGVLSVLAVLPLDLEPAS